MKERANRLAAESMHESNLHVGVQRVHRLAHEHRDAELSDEFVVEKLRVGEQLGEHEQVGSALTCHVEEMLSHVNGRRVAVVQAHAVKQLGCLPCVLAHVVPQSLRVFGRVAVAQFDVVTPRYQFASFILKFKFKFWNLKSILDFKILKFKDFFNNLDFIFRFTINIESFY